MIRACLIDPRRRFFVHGPFCYLFDQQSRHFFGDDREELRINDRHRQLREREPLA